MKQKSGLVSSDFGCIAEKPVVCRFSAISRVAIAHWPCLVAYHSMDSTHSFQSLVPIVSKIYGAWSDGEV